MRSASLAQPWIPTLTHTLPTPSWNPWRRGSQLAALSLRRAHLPPDFTATKIEEDDDDEGYLIAASRGGRSSCATAAWKDGADNLNDDKDVNMGPPSPSYSGYVDERGSSLAFSAGVDDPNSIPTNGRMTRSISTRSLFTMPSTLDSYAANFDIGPPVPS
ncbi:hypothetical protein GUJ93_ZPchr0002g22996 [Zizania palustris]|uniref:Uncharacterized protein n=1 Tax=Zizania palustris TaxID=103762 RepID=A0A8J5RZZ3_ZIZPA|nr:hypothetical protein GUJ93_ZPchr0002g22996 [Zizania palustris]